MSFKDEPLVDAIIKSAKNLQLQIDAEILSELAQIPFDEAYKLLLEQESKNGTK